jgi:hypothetical protein
MESALRVLLVDSSEQTRWKLTPPVKDKVFEQNPGFEQVEQRSPCHVFFRRPLHHTFVIDRIHAVMITRVIVQYVVIVVGRSAYL